MPYSIKISNLDNQHCWEKQLTAEDCENIKTYTKKGCDAISPLPATFKPVRTNNLQNFAKDFILPTLVNHAIKVQHAVGRVFAILASLILDILTFPIRLLTCIPRTISNALREENLLKKYLIKEGVDEKLLESDHVKMRLEWEQTSLSPTSYWTECGVQHSEYGKEKHWFEKNVNFIEIPIYPDWDESYSGKY